VAQVSLSKPGHTDISALESMQHIRIGYVVQGEQRRWLLRGTKQRQSLLCTMVRKAPAMVTKEIRFPS
jgi:hypothetical protein